MFRQHWTIQNVQTALNYTEYSDNTELHRMFRQRWTIQNTQTTLKYTECSDNAELYRMFRQHWTIQNVQTTLNYTECSDNTELYRILRQRWTTQNVQTMLNYTECSDNAELYRMFRQRWTIQNVQTTLNYTESPSQNSAGTVQFKGWSTRLSTYKYINTRRMYRRWSRRYVWLPRPFRVLRYCFHQSYPSITYSFSKAKRKRRYVPVSYGKA